MPRQSHDAQYNRDQDQKPGRPQRSATEPGGAKPSASPSQTATDPQSGAHQGRPPAPNQARTDQAAGAKGVRRR